MIHALFQRRCTCAWSSGPFLFLTTSSLLKPPVPLSDTSLRWRIPSIPCAEITLNLRVGSRLNEPFDALRFLLWSCHFLLYQATTSENIFL